MANDPVIAFAQRRFGTESHFPDKPGDRVVPPVWLDDSVLAQVSGSSRSDSSDRPVAVLSARDEDEPRMEGRGARRRPDVAADGTTADTFAFYLPFHFYRKTWGIYVRASGIWSLAKRLAERRKNLDVSALSSAYALLVEHERFHFRAEYAASRIEVVTGQPWYAPYFELVDAGRHEEALANASALRTLKRNAPSGLFSAAANWMKTQGPGYSDFDKWLPPCYVAGERLAAAYMVWVAGGSLNLLDPGLTGHDYDCHPAEFLFRSVQPRLVPIYAVVDADLPWIRFARPFPKQLGLQVFVYMNDHKPPHIHIDCPPGTARTRYTWPELVPLRGDSRLTSSEEKRLHQYLRTHGQAIDRRIAATPWK